jgi:hypothetical protein
MPKKIRKFKTGATRDTDDSKPDFHGFFAPLSMQRYGQYMHLHRKQSNGQLRDSDNWKKGMPQIEYVRSMYRHVNDLGLHFEGCGSEAREDTENALCAILFNAQALLYETVKSRTRCSSRSKTKS